MVVQEIPNIADVLMKFGVPGEILQARVAGSWAHNCNIEGSDVDYQGVYIAPTDDIVGLWNVKETVDGHNPDYSFHEVGKFAGLLMKGNPTIVESLFTERMQYVTGPWQELKDKRDLFINARTMRQYLGYAQGQLRRLENKLPLKTTGHEYNTKWAYHIARLSDDAFAMAGGGQPEVWYEGQRRDKYLAIRRGEWDSTRVGDYVRETIRMTDALKPWKIPNEPNTKWLNNWLLNVRKENWT